jgi:3',5'-cyclic AMP phosphodiesterase CpdA
LRFLHCSDIHLLDLTGVGMRRFLNKRITGGLNLALRRGRKHDGSLFDRIVERGKELGAERLVITGDLTNLSLESEFDHVRERLDTAGLPVTVIPGNHDAYTRGAARSSRFEEYLSHHMEGERAAGTLYPFVQRHGDMAFIGLSTAIPSLPLYAVGEVGEAQLRELDDVLAKLGDEGIARVVLIHHPPVPGHSHDRHQLLDLDGFGEVIARRGAELILHGHEHTKLQGELTGPGDSSVPVHGISSGTARSQAPGHRAAFSIYEVAPGLVDRIVHVWTGEHFEPLESGEAG